MSDLRPVHVDSRIDPGNMGKTVAGLIVALAILVIAGFGWHAGWWKGNNEAVPNQDLPQASMPLNAPAKS